MSVSVHFSPECSRGVCVHPFILQFCSFNPFCRLLFSKSVYLHLFKLLIPEAGAVSFFFVLLDCIVNTI